jgi:hypothetical protein
VDDHILARSDRPCGPQPLQCGDRRHRHGRCLLEGDAGRLQGQGILAGAHVLGKPAQPAPSEIPVDRVAWPKLRDVASNRRNPPGNVGTEDRALWPA